MKFFGSLYGLMNWRCEYEDPFLVQYEIPVPKDERTHLYIVFNGIQEYMRSRYRTCHEVFISNDGWDRDADVIGHPAFDIDAPLDTLTGDWQKILEDDIIDTLCLLHPKREEEIRDTLSNRSMFVWMASPTDKKISRHLTIAGITFSQWRWTSKVLYRELMKKHTYIDNMILRNCGSLRLPDNSKVGGQPLYFQDPDHTFTDGLVLIHSDNMYSVGMLLMPSDVNQTLLTIDDIVDKKNDSSYSRVEDYDEDICVRCFNKLDRTFDTGLVMGDERDGFVSLVRERPGTCPISGRTHDNVGAYLFSREGRIYFGCHRGCTLSIGDKKRKTIDISIDNIKISDSIAKSCPDQE